MRRELRTPIRPMTWQEREYKDEYVRAGVFDRNVPELTAIWNDNSMFADAGVRNDGIRCYWFSSSYTPWGVYCIYATFLIRMGSPRAGDSKRRIKRDIQSNPHLHPKLKSQLLGKLVKASVRYNGRGYREADGVFSRRIQGLRTIDGPCGTRADAEKIRRDIVAHPCLPEHVKENLLYNLASYEAELEA